MKLLLNATILILSFFQVYSQQIDFTESIFKTKSNLAITKVFHRFPSEFYLVSKADSWSADRFKSNKHPGRHSEANEPYIFADTTLDSLFSSNEKHFLALKSKDTTYKQINRSYRKLHLIDSFKQVIKGYLFSITNPIYSTDSNYAFIDMNIYYKTSETKELTEAYYGDILFIYKHSKKGGWFLLKKMDNIIL